MARPRFEYIYGVNPAFEVLRGDKRPVKSAYLAQGPELNPRLRKLRSFLQSKAIPIEMVDKSRLFELCRTREHQGVVLQAKTYPYEAFEDILGARRVLLLDNVEDPHNVGAILRSAEIFGFHHILLPLKGTPDVYPSVVKVSAGATEHLHIVREMNANKYVQRCQEEGYQVAALDVGGDVSLDGLAEAQATSTNNIVLVIGGEDKGVGHFILRAAEHRIRLEQSGRVNSLNASVAAAIAMYSLRLREPGSE